MRKLILFCGMLMLPFPGWSAELPAGLQVDVSRDGSRYAFAASFSTSLSTCAAYHYLTDYDAARLLPGVVESSAVREAPDRVRVRRVADEQVLFFHVRVRSVMEYIEKPADERIEFSQLAGDSKLFRGDWVVEPEAQGSRLVFHGVWEPDSVIPLFIIDHFAKNGLMTRFSDIARLAEQRKPIESARCTETRSMARNTP